LALHKKEFGVKLESFFGCKMSTENEKKATTRWFKVVQRLQIMLLFGTT
jgi:hypothetical protein